MGGFVGVAGAQVRLKADDGCAGRESAKGGGDGVTGKLGGAGADEEDVGLADAEKDFCVADEAGGADVVSLLGEDGGGKGAEVAGLLEEHDGWAGFGAEVAAGVLLEEGEDGVLFGGKGGKDGGEARHVEELGDEGRGRGEAEASVALAEERGIADEKAEAGAVEASDLGEMEDELAEVAAVFVQDGSFEGLPFFAGEDAAPALDDVNATADAGFQFEEHGASFLHAVGARDKREMTALREGVGRARMGAMPGRKGKVRFGAVLAMLAAGSWAAAPRLDAQAAGSDTAGAEEPGLVLQQTVRRVVVDVVVRDDHGQPVTGLRAGDFKVFEDGKAQPVRQFDAHNPATAEVLPARPAALPAHTFVNLPAAQEEQYAPLTVILFDALNTPLGDQLYARQEMLKFLREMPERSPTAIFVLSDRLHLLQGFSGEREVLLAAGRKQRAIPDQEGLLPAAETNAPTSPLTAPGPAQTPGLAPPAGTVPGSTPENGAGMPVPVSGPVSAEVLMTQMADEVSGDLTDRRVQITQAALQELGRFLSSVPGRKNLIWISGSFPASIAPDVNAGPMAFESERNYSSETMETDNLLSMSHVAVYPVDARGLMAPIVRSGPGTAQDFAADLAATQGTMAEIAEDTGGTAYYNTNELLKAYQSALDNGSTYYSLTYAPTNPNFDGKLRRIRVEVNGKGYRLAYRRSYFAVDSGGTASEDLARGNPPPGSLLAALAFGAPAAHELVFAARVNAVGAATEASEQQMSELLPYLEAADRNEGLNFHEPKKPLEVQRYVVQFGVMARQLELPKGNDGKYHPELSFGVMAYDGEGNALGGEQTTVEGAIPADKLDELKKQGYQAVQNVYVPVTAASLRVAVRDGRSSRMGSLEIPLPLAPAGQ